MANLSLAKFCSKLKVLIVNNPLELLAILIAVIYIVNKLIKYLIQDKIKERVTDQNVRSSAVPIVSEQLITSYPEQIILVNEEDLIALSDEHRA